VVYPGTTIQIPAVAVGQRFGTVPSTVHSKFLYVSMNRIHPRIQDWHAAYSESWKRLHKLNLYNNVSITGGTNNGDGS